MSEVPDFVALAQHFLQADRIGIVLAVFEAVAVSDTVAHAGDAHRALTSCRYRQHTNNCQ